MIVIILELPSGLEKVRFHDQNHEAEETAGEVFPGKNAIPTDCQVYDREDPIADLRFGR